MIKKLKNNYLILNKMSVSNSIIRLPKEGQKVYYVQEKSGSDYFNIWPIKYKSFKTNEKKALNELERRKKKKTGGKFRLVSYKITASNNIYYCKNQIASDDIYSINNYNKIQINYYK